MAFVLEDVINEIEETRSLEPLKKFKKENLVKVAVHYGITPAVGATKSHILNLIKDMEAQKEAAAREHELKMASLGEQSPSDKASAFDPARNIRLVPPFQEKEVDKYFAQEIYGSLSVEQSSNYEHVKEAILKAYELVPEAYRQKFRNYLKYDSKTHDTC